MGAIVQDGPVTLDNRPSGGCASAGRAPNAVAAKYAHCSIRVPRASKGHWRVAVHSWGKPTVVQPRGVAHTEGATRARHPRSRRSVNSYVSTPPRGREARASRRRVYSCRMINWCYNGCMGLCCTTPRSPEVLVGPCPLKATLARADLTQGMFQMSLTSLREVWRIKRTTENSNPTLVSPDGQAGAAAIKPCPRNVCTKRSH